MVLKRDDERQADGRALKDARNLAGAEVLGDGATHARHPVGPRYGHVGSPPCPACVPSTTFVRQRLSPERTRHPTLAERLTVRRLPWDTIVRLNAWLELTGRIATALWIASLALLSVGIDWQSLVEDAINSGRPVKRALLLAVVLATMTFLLTRSLLIAARWRLQRELWRRDVERLGGQETPLSAATTRDSEPRR